MSNPSLFHKRAPLHTITYIWYYVTWTCLRLLEDFFLNLFYILFLGIRNLHFRQWVSNTWFCSQRRLHFPLRDIASIYPKYFHILISTCHLCSSVLNCTSFLKLNLLVLTLGRLETVQWKLQKNNNNSQKPFFSYEFLIMYRIYSFGYVRCDNWFRSGKKPKY